MQSILKLTLLVALLLSPLVAKEFFISQNKLANIEKDYGKITANRIAHYVKFMRKISHMSKTEQIKRLNFYLNQSPAKFDDNQYKRSDFWSTRKEFLLGGGGDCEDYVSAKYFSLKDLGYDTDRLYFSVAKVKNIKWQEHMVLSYYPPNSDIPLILDNLSSKVLPKNVRKDLELVYSFNENGAFEVDKQGRILRMIRNAKVGKFDALLERVDKNFPFSK